MIVLSEKSVFLRECRKKGKSGITPRFMSHKNDAVPTL